MVMARPRKKPTDNRTNVLRIRLTSNERKELEEGAKVCGLDTSTWARFELLARVAKLRKERPIPNLRTNEVFR